MCLVRAVRSAARLLTQGVEAGFNGGVCLRQGHDSRAGGRNIKNEQAGLLDYITTPTPPTTTLPCSWLHHTWSTNLGSHTRQRHPKQSVSGRSHRTAIKASKSHQPAKSFPFLFIIKSKPTNQSQPFAPTQPFPSHGGTAFYLRCPPKAEYICKLTYFQPPFSPSGSVSNRPLSPPYTHYYLMSTSHLPGLRRNQPSTVTVI